MSFLRPSGWNAIVIGAVALIGIGATASAMLAPSPGTQHVAVMFAPWTPAGEAVQRATQPGARLVGFGGLNSIVIVAPDHPTYAHDIAARGAWLVADAARALGCRTIEMD